MFDLELLVKEYRERPPSRYATVRFCATSPNIAVAIERAVLARDSCGNKHPHQWRISNNVLNRTAVMLKRLQRKFGELGRRGNFQLLYDLILENRPKGFGELAAYDTALRLGEFLGTRPSRIYLHAGARVGALALAEKGLLNDGLKLTHKVNFLEMNAFPKAIRSLEPFEIEDFLCVYKDLKSLSKLCHAFPSGDSKGCSNNTPPRARAEPTLPTRYLSSRCL